METMTIAREGETDQPPLWKDLEEEDSSGLLANVPKQLASRIHQMLGNALKLTTTNQDWKVLFQDRNGVTAFTRKLDKQRTMIKSTALVHVNAKQIFHLLIDVRRRKDVEENVQTDARLKRYNSHTFLDYYAYRAVWPTLARDFVVATHWRILEKKDQSRAICVLGCSYSDPELGALVKDHVRADLLLSLYLLEQVGDSRCRITRVLSFDMGGNVPRKLNKVILEQQATMPFVLAQYLTKTETEQSPSCRRLLGDGVLSNESLEAIVKDVRDQ